MDTHITRATRTPMEAPPSYPESVSSFDPEAYYAGSDDASVDTHLSPDPHHDRRFSVASEVLPPDMMYHPRRESNYSYGSDGRLRLDYSNTTGLPSPPLSTSQPSPSMIANLRLDTARDGQVTPPIPYFPLSETDDPAVRVSLFPAPPTHRPSSTSAASSPRSPGRRNTGGTQRSPVSPPFTVPQPLQQQQQQPTLPYTCTFRDHEYGQMALVPPDTETNQTPMYTIDVHPNCFMPTSYITTVWRGREFVGRFEMGISRGEPTVFMGQKLLPMKDVFTNFRKVNSLLRPRWNWTRDNIKLHWDCRDEKESLCSIDNDTDKVIAKLIPASAQPPGSMSTRPPATRLELWVLDQAIVDEIVVSALIVERKRLSPSDGNKNETLFN